MASAALHLDYAGLHVAAARVAGRLQQTLQRSAPGDERHQSSLFDESHVLRPDSVVVDDVRTGHRPPSELSKRRRVAHGKRVGEHAQTDAPEERRDLTRAAAASAAASSRFRRPTRQNRRHERLRARAPRSPAPRAAAVRCIPRRMARCAESLPVPPSAGRASRCRRPEADPAGSSRPA